MRWEIVAFGLNKKPKEITSQVELIPFIQPIGAYPEAVTRAEFAELQKTLQAERNKGATLPTVREFHRHMALAFHLLFTGQQWRIFRPAIEERIVVPHIAGDTWPAHQQSSPNGYDILIAQAFDLIKNELSRFKFCANRGAVSDS